MSPLTHRATQITFERNAMFAYGFTRRMTVALAAVAVAGLTLSGCAGNAAPEPTSTNDVPVELIPVEFKLGFTAGSWDAGEYVALANGYFEEEGLDVTLTEGQGSTANIQLLEGGQIDIAKVALSSVVTAVSQGGTVKMVSAHIQRQGSGVVADPSFTSVNDLDGATYAGVVYDFGTQLLPAFEAAAGVKLNVQMVDASAIPQIFVSGQTQGMTSQAWAENIQLDVHGVDYSFWPYSDFGVDPVGVGYVTSSAYLDAHADIVERFVRAALKGWQFVYDHPEDAAQIVVAAVPAIDPAIASGTTKVMVDFSHTTDSEGLPLGEVAASDVERTIKLLLDTGLITEAPAPADVYSNFVFE